MKSSEFFILDIFFLSLCVTFLIYYLCRLGSVLADLIHIYYREEGRRVKTRVEKRNFNSAELGIRCCFKVDYLLYHSDKGDAYSY